MDDKKNNQLDIELNQEVAQGTYANLAVITHSSSEFVLDFVRMMPGLPKAEVKSRVIVTPEHAKRLLATLQDNVIKYEKMYGEIKENKQEKLHKMPLNFGPLGEA
ncbi:uncharacterized protein DUF3467 [Balneicella halophila]|uniref:Uncharacterized protein DUF3467 n=1 Tax=Balneicella halophila TaxID=1537566 RepID=A0A7L4UPH0_BALHA|nr:DUF3467 domain-containing protein [Balneicella halophila]PVX50934.1 uncharacterized protein DUF3467 [Balneicella halophila]